MSRPPDVIELLRAENAALRDRVDFAEVAFDLAYDRLRRPDVAWAWAQIAQALLLAMWVEHSACYEALLGQREDRLIEEDWVTAARGVILDLAEAGVEVPAKLREAHEAAGFLPRLQ